MSFLFIVLIYHFYHILTMSLPLEPCLEEINISINWIQEPLFVYTSCNDRDWGLSNDLKELKIPSLKTVCKKEAGQCREGTQIIDFIIENYYNPHLAIVIIAQGHGKKTHYRESPVTSTNNFIKKGKCWDLFQHTGILSLQIEDAWVNFSHKAARGFLFDEMYSEFYRNTSMENIEEFYKDNHVSCCSSYIIHMDAVRKRPLSEYIKIRNNSVISAIKHSKVGQIDFRCAQVFEFTLPMLFSNMSQMYYCNPLTGGVNDVDLPTKVLTKGLGLYMEKNRSKTIGYNQKELITLLEKKGYKKQYGIKTVLNYIEKPSINDEKQSIIS